MNSTLTQSDVQQELVKLGMVYVTPEEYTFTIAGHSFLVGVVLEDSESSEIYVPLTDTFTEEVSHTALKAGAQVGSLPPAAWDEGYVRFRLKWLMAQKVAAMNTSRNITCGLSLDDADDVVVLFTLSPVSLENIKFLAGAVKAFVEVIDGEPFARTVSETSGLVSKLLQAHYPD